MPYYPMLIAFIAFGVYLLIRAVAIIDAYRILVKNREHIQRLNHTLLYKLRKKLNDF